MDEKSFLQDTGQSWLASTKRMDSLAMLHPALGLYQLNQAKEIPYVETWSASQNSPLQIARAFKSFNSPIIFEILFHPKQLLDLELRSIEKVIKQFDELTVSHRVAAWKEILTHRLENANALFEMEVRVFSPQSIYDTLLRSVGNAITQRSTSEHGSSISYQFWRPSKHSISHWSQLISNLEFIHPRYAISHPLQRLSTLASINEVSQIASLPFLIS
jgi:hypothetical protein